MTFRIAKMQGNELVKLEFKTFEEMKTYLNTSLEEYIKTNNVTNESSDRSYTLFKEWTEAMLTKYDYEKCFKCIDEDREGRFCRCEDRNIRIAKEQRKRNECPWSEKYGVMNKEPLTS